MRSVLGAANWHRTAWPSTGGRYLDCGMPTLLIFQCNTITALVLDSPKLTTPLY